MKNFYILWMIVLPVGLGAQIPAGQVAYYPFSGNTNAAMGNTNAINVGATLTADQLGNFNSAYQLTGWDDNQRIYIADSIISLSMDYTINGWFYLDSLNSTVGQTVLSSRHNTSGTELGGLSMGVNTQHKFFAVWRGGSPVVVIDNIRSNPLTPNQWYMYTVVQQGLNVALYINGVQVGTTTTLMNLATTVDFWNIGATYNGSILRELEGKVDEIRFFDRALTSSEITSLYGLPTAVRPIEKSQQHLTVYPNPTSGQVTVELATLTDGVLILLNTLGQSLWQYTLNGQAVFELNLQELVGHRQGIYYLSLQTQADHIVIPVLLK